MVSYIVASCKPWHRKAFERVRDNVPGNWLYVATQAELDQAVRYTTPRYIFFLHWNWMVSIEIWSRHECVCFHMTDVPYGRGGSPLQNLIVSGHAETKVTALRMVDEMDAGPVYGKRAMSLEGRAEDIYLRAGDLCWEMIVWLISNEPVPIDQKGEVTKFIRRKPEQSVLPDQGDLAQVFDHIRMLDAPTYPLAFIDYGDFRLEFSHAELRPDELNAQVVIKKRKKTNEYGK
jgi:methionyl-tRNA formyltransferase